jgi:hypothetical protein
VSSFDIPARSSEYRASVGWDPNLNSYFFHIVDPSRSVEDPAYKVFELGNRLNEVWSVDTIEDAVITYTGRELDGRVRATMQNEMHK